MTNLGFFAFAVLMLLAVPGPTNTLLFASGATAGFQRSLPLLTAEVLGYTLGILFVSPVARALGGGGAILGVIVSLYLIYVAVKLWRFGTSLVERPVRWATVFVTTLLNPKVLVFAFAIFPTAPTRIERYFLVFWSIVVPVGATWIAVGAFATRLAAGKPRTLVPRIAAVAMACVAALLIGTSLERYLAAGVP